MLLIVQATAQSRIWTGEMFDWFHPMNYNAMFNPIFWFIDLMVLTAELSPLEVYSADQLHDYTHCRATGIALFFSTTKIGMVVLQIRQEADSFIDKSSKSFHVAREHSEYFEEHAQQLPSMQQIQEQCQAIVNHGNTDNKRAPRQYRLNIGNGGQNWVDGAPCKFHGLQFEKDLEKTETLEASHMHYAQRA